MKIISFKVAKWLWLVFAVLAVVWWGVCARKRSPESPTELGRKVQWEGPWYYSMAKKTHTVRLFPTRLLAVGQMEIQISSARQQAVWALSRMGTNAWPAVPELVAAVNHPNLSIGICAADALSQIRAEECPGWAGLRKRLNGQTRAARALHYLVVGSNISGSSYDLVHRRFGLVGLAATGSAATNAYGDVVDIIKYTDESELRFWAVVVLGAIGPGRPETPSLLKKLLQDPKEWPNVRGAAAQALANVAPDEKETRTLLQQALEDPRPAVRLGAARGLWKVNASAEQVLAVLTALLSHPLASIRVGALEGVSEMGKAALGSKSEVERLASDSNDGVRRAAVAALKRLGA